MANVEVVICARNESERLPKTLDSLKAQTLLPTKIIMVNDGSTDGTEEIGRRYGCHIVNLPHHEKSLLGRPELAKVFNAGLQRIDPSTGYILILGADHSIPPEYVEKLVDYLEDNKKVALVSGSISSEPAEADIPRNSGMLARATVWRELNGVRYPVCWGYEAWLIFKLQSMGFKTALLSNLTSSTQRTTKSKGESDGKAMYALGYYWLFAIGRSLRIGLRSPRDGLAVFKGYLVHSGVQKLDVADWVSQRQKRRIWERYILRRRA
jgi:cellulose synthase/poly-beta-1,6-N-acetylglucosamine synthase-like glycosyltransferase